MTKRAASKPKLTDDERHQLFKEMAREVRASEDPADFERAFERVTRAERGKTATPKQS